MEMVSRKDGNPEIDPMREPQKHALLREWNSFKDYFQKEDDSRKALIQPFNLAKNTAIHIVARYGNLDLLQELLDMLPSHSDRREALRMGNAHGNRLLHQIVSGDKVEIVDLVLKYENKKGNELMRARDENLLELRNNLGEAPAYRAAKHGRMRMLKRMVRYVDDMEPHLYRDIDHASILHIAITGQHFGN